MPDEFFFMSLAGLGVSFAGFAGLISALDRRPEAHSPIAAWRIRNIVYDGFLLTLTGFGIIAIHGVTDGNVDLTVRIASVALALGIAGRNRPSNIGGPAWEGTNEAQSRATIVFGYVGAAVTLVNVVYASVGWLQIVYIFNLWAPISIFYNTIRDIAEGRIEPVDD